MQAARRKPESHLEMFRKFQSGVQPQSRGNGHEKHQKARKREVEGATDETQIFTDETEIGRG
jgi:hypothetical protein